METERCRHVQRVGLMGSIRLVIRCSAMRVRCRGSSAGRASPVLDTDRRLALHCRLELFVGSQQLSRHCRCYQNPLDWCLRIWLEAELRLGRRRYLLVWSVPSAGLVKIGFDRRFGWQAEQAAEQAVELQTATGYH